MNDKALIDLFREYLKYDESSPSFLRWAKSPMQRIKAGAVAGNIDCKGYWRLQLKGKDYLSHRVIYAIFNNYIPEIIDHIDTDRKNNKITNLRKVSASQNQFNRKINKNNRSGAKGIFWDEKRDEWVATIWKEKKIAYIGRFKNKKDAGEALIINRRKLHGEFANNG